VLAVIAGALMKILVSCPIGVGVPDAIPLREMTAKSMPVMLLPIEELMSTNKRLSVHLWNEKLSGGTGVN